MFNYPCVVQDAPAREFKGHCSHIMNVRFSQDMTYAVSVGGKDRGVFQWKMVLPQKPSRFETDLPWGAFQPMDKDGVIWAAKPQ